MLVCCMHVVDCGIKIIDKEKYYDSEDVCNSDLSATKRNDATRWLRKYVGVVAAKDLPAEPSENAFRMGLRSGIIFCKFINKIEPGAISKVTFFTSTTSN